ncbi:uncharacterized protein MYCFIDRAFT_213734 [Pseudocercospora fijiensis CIRAD86]|uniref:Uncharacterized protein n=1 Tax=Pseudocercospora fijiensis (strain CIRAD86) TaxID=383855 RepID=N1QCQ4_PSEFD|nr:uncharacterized protein MYCFIDRAFT_213734 [Pseudocercospora fijiensis CIRAD86]EME89612.1 hypothetical protein MYCFIDRAFT_213734 [Pseudocercospora fijiensis CIRAD86]
MSSSPTSPTNHSSSPFPSPSPSLPAWHFPFGPSSIYHQRERPKPQHTRFNSSYTPRAPVLSTEKRAHRRAQNSSLGSLTSPPLSECSRSPLSRFASYPSTMAKSKNNNAPITPAKSSRHSLSSLQGSPFSDYFSDDARSSINHNHAIPSYETKALLVRMNKLQAQLMRDNSEHQRQSINIVEKKLGEIELELNALHSQTRLPGEIEDSAVVSSEQDGAAKAPSHSRGPSTQSANSSAVFSDDQTTPENYKAERDWLLLRTQELLENLSSVTAELRQRHNEVKEMNEAHSVEIEEKDTQIEQLRSENEGLRQDLGFEYSELLFLKLQMNALECEMSELRDEKDDGPPTNAAERARREKKNRILSELDRWRTDSDWQDVSARFKHRRSKYGITTSPTASSTSLLNADPEIEWQLETQRETRGRITNLTIKRMDSNSGEGEEEVQPVTLNGTTATLPLPPPKFPSPPTFTYVETSTQTSDFYIPEEEDNLLCNNDDEHSNPDLDDECAITTSASSVILDPYENVEEAEEEEDEKTLKSADLRWKPAWKELWAGLQSLSGMVDEDEDEEDD